MKRKLKGTLKLFAWLALIVAFASYSVTPAFARMPENSSTTSENSRLRDHTTRTKVVLLTTQHPAESLHNHLGQLQFIDFQVLSPEGRFNKSSLSAKEAKALKRALAEVVSESLTEGKLNKRSLSAEEMTALKNAVTKAAAAKGCTMLEEAWGTCVKNCLADVGVSAYSLIICGATCLTPATLVCAICLGVSVAVIEACAVGCAVYAN